MGTSKSFDGPPGRSPLIPTWVPDDGNANGTVPGKDADNAPAAQPPDEGAPAVRPGTPAVLPNNPQDRFRAPRANLGRWAASGGTDRASGRRSVGRYARESLGGQNSGSRRLSLGRSATSRLYTALQDIRTRGVERALRDLGLADFIGQSAPQVMAALVDAICPQDVTLDDWVVREAFLDTVSELTNEGIIDFATMTDLQIERVLIRFICNVVQTKYTLDCGKRALEKTMSDASTSTLKHDLSALIEDMVGSHLDGSFSSGNILTGPQLASVIDDVYSRTIGLLMRGEHE